jgi:cysteine-rich repeat protein
MRSIVALLLVLSRVEPAMADRILVPLGALPPGATPPGLSRVEVLAIDRVGLAALRARDVATVDGFPLGGDAMATLDLVRFDPFVAGARVGVVDPGGERAGTLPDQRYYRGTVRGDAASRVLLVARDETVRGFAATAGTVYRFGPGAAGTHRSYALRDVDPSVFPAPGAFCDNPEHAALVGSAPGTAAVERSALAAAPPPVAAFSPTLMVEVAIETDQELRARFAGDDDAIEYLADLAAAVSAIYDADTQVRVRFRSIRIWNVPDPWTGTSTSAMLSELKAYWDANEGATPRDVVHFVSGKSGLAGLAYVDVLCNPAFAYGVSKVRATFDVMDPGETWDVVVTAHEIGHNFGSEHTHCYVPELDQCHNQEAGCYAGPTSLPPGGGTIMSYCHLLAGGIANVNLTFGTTVSAVLRTGAESGLCVGPPCPDGILDPGEDCDDGNYDAGDCCSPACTLEPDGGSCDDDNDCTDSDQCASGACEGAPVVDGSSCDDGSVCTADACASGACVGTPDPAPACKLPTLPLKAQLVMKDKDPDKGDQVVWKWTKGEATDVLVDFGAPLTADEANDFTLCVYGAGPTVLFSAHVPSGGTCGTAACWKAAGTTGFGYKDKLRTPNGAEKLSLKAGIAGASKAAFKGKGDNLEMPALGGFPLPVRVQLRRQSGTCFESVHSTPLVETSEQFKAKSD